MTENRVLYDKESYVGVGELNWAEKLVLTFDDLFSY